MNFDDFKEVLPGLINICMETGKYQIKYHRKSLEIKVKANKTLVTEIDIHSSNMIKNKLNQLTPKIPVVSEEDARTNNHLDYFWIIDPLDGTKHYLQGNNNFCINIALIQKNQSILGLIYSPIFNNVFYAFRNRGAYKQINNKRPVLIKTKKFSIKQKTVVYTSSSINENVCRILRKRFKNIEIITSGSALKFSYIASGQGSFYPRLGPTHEWDTAAGQCIVEEAGGLVVDKFMQKLEYNKNQNYLNNEFFVVGDPLYNWEQVIKSVIS